jgi:periplasmic protein TonB
MFTSLPASGPRSGLPFSGGMLAACAHGAVIAVAVWATAVRAAPPRATIVQLPLLPEPPVAHGPAPVRAPDIGECLVCDLGHIPISIPAGTFDSLLPRVSGTSPGAAVSTVDAGHGGDGVVSEDLVDQRPEVLAGPPLIYPELLRQAGIEGRVLVRAVVDTLGRVEVGSASVVASANPGFDATALAYVRRALFRPARVLGHAVRVLVEVPIEFQITR